MATGALCFLTSQGCSYIKVQPEELQPALGPLMACALSDDQALQEHATGALANAARHAKLQPYFTESNCHVALLQLVVSGSEITCANCGRALEPLAKSSTASHHFSQLPVLQQLVALLSNSNISSQRVSLSICCNLFASWPDSQHLTAAALHEAIEQFIELRGMTALRCLFQTSQTQESAASCLSMLAHLEPSPSAFASSGTLQLLLQRLKSHERSSDSLTETLQLLLQNLTSRERPFETQAATTSAANTCQHAAEAVAILMQDSECAAVAIQPASLKLILQLFHAPSAAIWEAALQATTRLAEYDDSGQHIAASEALDASIVKEVLYQAPGCHSLNATLKQAQLIHILCRSKVCQKTVVDGGGCSFLSRELKSQDSRIQQQAAGAIRQLAKYDNAIAERCWEGGIPAQLVELLHSTVDSVQINAAAAITNLACGDANHELQLASLGSLKPLVRLLSSASTDVRAQAAEAIRNICWNHDACREQAADLGALSPLITMSTSTHAKVKEAAQGCLRRLTLSSAVKQQIQALQT